MKYSLNQILHADCMDVMKEIPDKYFELAIVDPPYGIGRAGQSETFTKNPKHKRKHHQSKEWDNELPSAEYFAELFRVSNNQIIWGANYFTEFIPSSMGWVFWDKGQDLSMSDGELAFTSFDVALRRTIINRVELLKDGTIHPTQKPVKLYKWLLDKYAKQGDKILDTHGGSCSLAIACIDYGFEYLITEKDEDYYREAIKRVTNFNNQFNLFL